MLQRIDIILSLIIGFAFGWFAIPTITNFGIELGGFSFLLPLVFSVLAAFSIFTAWLAAKFWSPLFQFAKFAAVGALNFSIDFGVLNALILVTDITAGYWFIAFKTTSVVVAVTNSYLWNKFWTFKEREFKDAGRQFLEFLIITFIGIGVNVGTAHLIVNIVGTKWGIDPKVWANIGAGASVLITLFWNFFGYKFLVFRKPPLVQ